MNVNFEQAVKLINQNKLGILPTDTLYGIVGLAMQPQIVERIYKLRRRDKNKPMIVLIGELAQLDMFKLDIPKHNRQLLSRFWPGAVSVILPCKFSEFKYLHRGMNSLALRLPDYQPLQELLRQTGPLVAPSANIQGRAPATTVAQAKNYFGDQLDFYVNVGELQSQPSTLIDASGDKLRLLRNGKVDLKI